MKIENYGFESFGLKHVKWYAQGFTGIKILGRRFIGFSIHNDKIVINLKTMESKPEIGVWLYIFFYNIHIEIKNAWENEKDN